MSDAYRGMTSEQLGYRTPIVEDPTVPLNAQEARIYLAAALRYLRGVTIHHEAAMALDGACYHLRLPLFTSPCPQAHPSKVSAETLFPGEVYNLRGLDAMTDEYAKTGLVNIRPKS